MPKRLRVKHQSKPALVIHRAAFRHDRLVYVVCANKALRYPLMRSRIAYIGTTRNGARRIASSAVWKGWDLLQRYGVKSLSIHVVVCRGTRSVKTWELLERALIIRFREKHGAPPLMNRTGHKTKWKRERRFFSDRQLDQVIDGLSQLQPA